MKADPASKVTTVVKPRSLTFTKQESLALKLLSELSAFRLEAESDIAKGKDSPTNLWKNLPNKALAQLRHLQKAIALSLGGVVAQP